jgi:hypothetical protein
VFFGNYYRSKGFDIKIYDIINNMEITGLKRDSLLKTGKKLSHSKFVGTTGRDNQKRDNPVLNGTSGHPTVVVVHDDDLVSAMNDVYFMYKCMETHVIYECTNVCTYIYLIL